MMIPKGTCIHCTIKTFLSSPWKIFESAQRRATSTTLFIAHVKGNTA